MACTLLDEKGFTPDVIELQLVHAERNKQPIACRDLPPMERAGVFNLAQRENLPAVSHF